MSLRKRQIGLFNLVLGIWLAVAAGTLFAQAAPSASAHSSPAGAASAAVKQLGSIREISGSRLLLVTDQGEEFRVQVQSGARLLRLAPGQSDLKTATTIQLSDLQVGDRALVRGTLEADGKGLEAASVLVMKQQDIAHRQREEMQDWQHRGVGGLVQQVDAQSGTVTISVARPARMNEARDNTIVVRSTPKTAYRRYAPDSIKWEEAAPSQFGEIRVGDQLRVRGNLSEDGRQLEAEEMVFGSFRNIAGPIASMDAAQATLTVDDLQTKKPVTVQIDADSKIRELPPQMAQGLAMRLRSEGQAPEQSGAPASGTTSGGTISPTRTRGGDLNQALSRLPAATLAQLQKGEAVMIVSTAGSAGQLPHAIIVLGGAEPILRANPSGRSTEGLLTPWSLGAAPGGEQP